MPLESGGYSHLQGAGGSTAFGTVSISGVNESSIDFNVGCLGSSWSGQTGYLYKINFT